MNGYFGNLETELVAAARREVSAKPTRNGVIAQLRTRRIRRVGALTVGVALLAGVPAAALTGVFTPHTEPDGLVRLSERSVIARGSTPDRGQWELLASRSDVGFCFGIRLPSGDIGDVSTTVSEGCGGAEPGQLSLASSSGGSLKVRALVFGMTPDGAVAVRVRADDVDVTVKTIDDLGGLAGRVYVAELPTREALGSTRVEALDAGGAIIDAVSRG